MSIDSTVPFGEEWIVQYFAMVDRLDPDELVGWYDEEGSFRFANQPAAHGKQAIAETLRQFYTLIEQMHHQKRGVWVEGDTGVWEADVTFHTRQGEIVLPAVSVLRLRGGKIHDFRMYMDASPLTDAPRS